jgi:hypothetical protein
MATVWSRRSLGYGALVLSFLFTLGGVVVAVLFAIWEWGDRGHAAGDEVPLVYSRDDFASSVLGKTEAEVLDAVGKPDATSEDNEATYWHYRKRTKDLSTGRIDSDVQVVFQNGTVTALNY